MVENWQKVITKAYWNDKKDNNTREISFLCLHLLLRVGCRNLV